MWKLCLSTKFPHQEIRWNYGIFRSVAIFVLTKNAIFVFSPHFHHLTNNPKFSKNLTFPNPWYAHVVSRQLYVKVNNRNTRTRCEVCSKLAIKIPERRHWRRSGIFIVNFEHTWRRSGIFIVNFEHTSHLALVLLLLTLSNFDHYGQKQWVLNYYMNYRNTN